MNRLTVFKASAGAGKTFQLALRYVVLLLSYECGGDGRRRLYYPTKAPARHREILAITFTNKATEEMKARIINVLKNLSDPDGDPRDPYRSKLLEIIDCKPSDLAKAAREALASLLFDFGEINISTIDSFFQSILRSFAYEADLSGNYDLLIDQKGLLEMAIAETLAAATRTGKRQASATPHSAKLRAWLHSFLSVRMKEGSDITVYDRNSALRKDLFNFINKLYDENYLRNADTIDSFLDAPLAVETLQDALARKLDELNERVATLASELALPENASLLNSRSTATFLRLASEGRFADYSDSNLKAIAAPEESAEKWILKKASDNDRLAVAPKIENLLRLCRLQLTAAQMHRNIYNLGLFSETLKTARDMKLSGNAILLSDTNTLLHRIIGNNPAPFIYERTGRRLRNFLIDEFQDTSRLQWENLAPLLAESLGSGNDNLVIGDVKQCIYRFRNAEPSLLDHELEDALAPYVDTPRLLSNFRSSPVVVNFNSCLFELIARRENLSSSYATVAQQPVRNDLAGHVTFAALPPAVDPLDDMIERIARQLDPAGGNYSPADIVVLVREKSRGEKVVERLLLESRADGRLPGVKVLSDEALFIRNSRAVRFIIDRMRELGRIKRDESSMSDADNRRTATTEREIEWMKNFLLDLNSQGITGNEAISTMMSRFDELNRRAPHDENAGKRRQMQSRGSSLFQIVERIIADLPDPSWADSEAVYLCAFQDLVIDFSRTASPSISAFMTLWDNVLAPNAAIGLAAGIEAIRVMTIHKAKGLEFPCVHIPYLDMPMTREDSFRWYSTAAVAKELQLPCDIPALYPLRSSRQTAATLFSREYAELCARARFDTVNVLYVAFTRAISELSVTMKARAQSSDCVVNLLRTCLEEMLGRPLDPDAWQSEFGAPTRKPSPAPAACEPDNDTIVVPAYRTGTRTDLWQFSDPDTTL